MAVSAFDEPPTLGPSTTDVSLTLHAAPRQPSAFDEPPPATSAFDEPPPAPMNAAAIPAQGSVGAPPVPAPMAPAAPVPPPVEAPPVPLAAGATGISADNEPWYKSLGRAVSPPPEGMPISQMNAVQFGRKLGTFPLLKPEADLARAGADQVGQIPAVGPYARAAIRGTANLAEGLGTPEVAVGGGVLSKVPGLAGRAVAGAIGAPMVADAATRQIPDVAEAIGERHYPEAVERAIPAAGNLAFGAKASLDAVSGLGPDLKRPEPEPERPGLFDGPPMTPEQTAEAVKQQGPAMIPFERHAEAEMRAREAALDRTRAQRQAEPVSAFDEPPAPITKEDIRQVIREEMGTAPKTTVEAPQNSVDHPAVSEPDEHQKLAARLRETSKVAAFTPEEIRSLEARASEPGFNEHDLSPDEKAKLVTIKNLRERQASAQVQATTARSHPARGAGKAEADAIEEWLQHGGEPPIRTTRGGIDPGRLAAPKKLDRMERAVAEEYKRDGGFENNDEMLGTLHEIGIKTAGPETIEPEEGGDTSFEFGENEKAVAGKRDNFGPRKAGASREPAPDLYSDEPIRSTTERAAAAADIYRGGPPGGGGGPTGLVGRGGNAEIETPDRISAFEAHRRGLREKLAPEQRQYGERVAGSLAGLETAPALAKGVWERFKREAFGKNEAEATRIKNGMVGVGYHGRAEQLREQGKDPSGIPDIGAEDAERLMRDPKIARAVDLWMRTVEPGLQAIRKEIGWPVNTWGEQPRFQLNLRVSPRDTAVDFGAAKRGNPGATREMADEAFGQGDYVTDTDKVLSGIISKHVNTHARVQLRNEIEKAGLFFDPEQTHIEPDGSHSAMINGKKETLMPSMVDGEEPKYAPKRLVDLARKTAPIAHSNIADKALDLGVSASLGLGADVAPHIRREFDALSALMAQSGVHPEAMVPWIGSRVAAGVEMKRMAHEPEGEVMQYLLEKGGGDRGVGFRASTADQSKTAKVLGFGHSMIFGQKYGADVLMRRAGGKSFLMAKYDPAAIQDVLDRANAGSLSPVAAGVEIEKMLGPDGVSALARDVNSTFGYNNHLLRPDILNHAQRFAPYIGSQAGMIPGEIRRTVGLNLSPSKIRAQVKGGRYGQAAIGAASSMLSGPVGSMIAMQALNMAMGKSRGEDGGTTFSNPAGHKLDVRLTKKWYLTNLDAGLTRANRLIGATKGVEDGAEEGVKSIGREGLNEGLSSVSPLLKMVFSAAVHKTTHFTPGNRLMEAKPGWWYPLGVGREIAQTESGGDQPMGDSLKQAGASLVGLRIKNSDQDYAGSRKMPGQAKAFVPPKPGK